MRLTLAFSRLFSISESNAIFHSPNSKLNTYSGGQFQQSASGLTETNENTYEYLPNGQLGSGFAVYAYEYEVRALFQSFSRCEGWC
jgi:hypothetical protein